MKYTQMKDKEIVDYFFECKWEQDGTDKHVNKILNEMRKRIGLLFRKVGYLNDKYTETFLYYKNVITDDLLAKKEIDKYEHGDMIIIEDEIEPYFTEILNVETNKLKKRTISILYDCIERYHINTVISKRYKEKQPLANKTIKILEKLLDIHYTRITLQQTEDGKIFAINLYQHFFTINNLPHFRFEYHKEFINKRGYHSDEKSLLFVYSVLNKLKNNDLIVLFIDPYPYANYPH